MVTTKSPSSSTVLSRRLPDFGRVDLSGDIVKHGARLRELSVLAVKWAVVYTRTVRVGQFRQTVIAPESQLWAGEIQTPLDFELYVTLAESHPMTTEANSAELEQVECPHTLYTHYLSNNLLLQPGVQSR